MHTKVAVIGGAGSVGASIAYALVLQQVHAEILIVDVAEKQAEGQALDLCDAAYLSISRCRKASFKEAGQADVIIITAGAKQRPGEKRSELIDRNYNIIKSIMDSIQPISPMSKILIISNPVDVLTYIAQKVSGHPKHLVIGSGTFLDSGRLRNYLGRIVSISPSSIHAYSLGEHGDSQFVAWSSASVAGMPLLSHPKMKGQDLEAIKRNVAKLAYDIIEAKGSTYYGVAAHVAFLAKALLQNTDQVFPVSHYSEKFGCYFSWPAVIGANGVQQSVDLSLNDDEREHLHKAIDSITSLTNRY
ncbi:hypothetical protein H4219_000620 [Mycoemilia scoparia]|uniref:L-lactate dehydrogenase n=1 Tax=Mycoemilia scoparia TaxID=417184 RepID=A0A9W8A5M4_9FUNG|nr:hypothetical protein H4219_000620 [Mycoemilia scoparia]